MRIVTKSVYYCEFCGKHGLSRPAMEKHEKHCTKNPHRACRMCDLAGGVAPKTVIRVKQPLTRRESDDLTRALLARVEGCPACMLAIIRQALPPFSSTGDRLLSPGFGTLNRSDGFCSWDYREEVDQFWRDVNPSW